MRRLPQTLAAAFPSRWQRYHLSWTSAWRRLAVGVFSPPAPIELIFMQAGYCTIEIPLEIIEL
jgi:hypothetical protein